MTRTAWVERRAIGLPDKGNPHVSAKDRRSRPEKRGIKYRYYYISSALPQGQAGSGYPPSGPLRPSAHNAIE